MPQKIDHIAIATPSLDEGSAPYLALGLTPLGPDEEVQSQGVRVRVFRVGESLIELLAPAHEHSPIARFLERRGPGMHHLALRVEDVEAEMTRLKALGARFLSGSPTPGRGGSQVVFLHPSWGAGSLIELVQHD